MEIEKTKGCEVAADQKGKKNLRKISKKGLVGLIGLISAASILLFLIFVFLLSSATVLEIVSAVTCPANQCCANCTSWPHSCNYAACHEPNQCQLTGNNCPAGTRPNITTEVWCEHDMPGSDCPIDCIDENGWYGVWMGTCHCDCVIDEVPPGGCTEYCPYSMGHLYQSCRDGTHLEYAYEGTECRRNWYSFNDANCNSKKLTAMYFHQGGSSYYKWRDANLVSTENENPLDTRWCSDGHDNDCDGRKDKNDTDCDPTPPTVPVTCLDQAWQPSQFTQPPGNCSCAGGVCIRNYTDDDSLIYVALEAQDPSPGGGIKEVRYCLVSGNIVYPDPENGISNETAEYDPTFGAPSCITGGSPCIAPDSLIEGKDGGVPWQFSWEGPFYPPEKNAPNTIDNCIDWGNMSNSTVESIKVWVNDADKTINQGNTLNYEIKYYCGCGYLGCSQAQMCIFYTNNANSPSWGQPIKSQTCSGTGEQKVTGTITLTGSSGYHAIRGFIRDPKGSGVGTGPCDGGNGSGGCSSPTDQLYADFDDLVFYAAPSGSCTPTILLNPDWMEGYDPDGMFRTFNYFISHDANSTVKYKVWDRARNSVNGSYTAKLQKVSEPTPPANPTPPYFIVRKGASDNKAIIGSNGAMNITGSLHESQSSITSSGNDFIVKNPLDTVVATIDGTSGDLYLTGILHEYNGDPGDLDHLLSWTECFMVKNSAGHLVALVDGWSGDFYLLKKLNQNSPVNP